VVAFNAGDVLGAADLNEAFNELDINAQTGTTYTLVLADRGGLVTLSNASAITLTVPTNASVAYAVGTQIGLLQTGAGQVTISPASGVTVTSFGSLTKLAGNGALAVLVKTATNTWYLSGQLSA
jgi:hypothetical protein